MASGRRSKTEASASGKPVSGLSTDGVAVVVGVAVLSGVVGAEAVSVAATVAGAVAVSISTLGGANVGGMVGLGAGVADVQAASHAANNIRHQSLRMGELSLEFYLV